MPCTMTCADVLPTPRNGPCQRDLFDTAGRAQYGFGVLNSTNIGPLHVGCAMWTHAPWQGRYLPRALPPRERLSAYATWCNAVEGNTTFYATPALDTVKTWAEQTSPDFRFILKLPRAVTH